MICAISRAAIIEAARHGKDSTSFHGYQITAKRIGAGSAADGLIEVTLCAERGSGRSESAVIEVARLPYLGSAWLIEPCRHLAALLCRTTFLVGCVSPIDARYASPETGQIS